MNHHKANISLDRVTIVTGNYLFTTAIQVILYSIYYYKPFNTKLFIILVAIAQVCAVLILLQELKGYFNSIKKLKDKLNNNKYKSISLLHRNQCVCLSVVAVIALSQLASGIASSVLSFAHLYCGSINVNGFIIGILIGYFFGLIAQLLKEYLDKVKCKLNQKVISDQDDSKISQIKIHNSSSLVRVGLINIFTTGAPLAFYSMQYKGFLTTELFLIAISIAQLIGGLLIAIDLYEHRRSTIKLKDDLENLEANITVKYPYINKKKFMLLLSLVFIGQVVTATIDTTMGMLYFKYNMVATQHFVLSMVTCCIVGLSIPFIYEYVIGMKEDIISEIVDVQAREINPNIVEEYEHAI